MNNSYNVENIIDRSPGKFTVNITSGVFDDGNYTFILSGSAGGEGFAGWDKDGVTTSATELPVRFHDRNGAFDEPDDYYSVVIYDD